VGPPDQREERQRHNGSVLGDAGPWAGSQAGPNRSPAAFLLFLISFSFFFF
jgi:hypothetical protein